jgi:hypothetical protein
MEDAKARGGRGMMGRGISLQTLLRIPLPIIPLPNLLCGILKLLPRKALNAVFVKNESFLKSLSKIS